MIGLFITNGFEVLDKRDTMPSLVAVLDTNFWLATHVTVDHDRVLRPACWRR